MLDHDTTSKTGVAESEAASKSNDGQENITELLLAWRSGEDAALLQLMPIVYRRLKRTAASFLRSERKDHTLQPTALVHECYLRLIRLTKITWKDRCHFFSVCARLMRRVLVEHARYHGCQKRGAGGEKVTLDVLQNIPFISDYDLLTVDEALLDLAKKDPRMADIAVLRYFGGLTQAEIAEALSISTKTVSQKLRMAQAWLGRYLSVGEDSREA